MDDTFVIFDGSEDETVELVNFLNEIDNNIQFTIELANNNSLPFLDLQIKREENKLSFNIYRKPTTTTTA